MTKTYICPNCGEFEHECGINDKELDKCPKCHKKVKRIFKPVPSIWVTTGACGKLGG